MIEQLSMLPPATEDEDINDLIRQGNLFKEYANKKRRWENAFQKWSNSQFADECTSLGKCGYGSIQGRLGFSPAQAGLRNNCMADRPIHGALVHSQ